MKKRKARNKKTVKDPLSQKTKNLIKNIIFIILILGAALVGFQTNLYAMALGVIIGYLVSQISIFSLTNVHF
ncbi:hypothetical protein CMI42_05515 [Candidatus Pacearchaeota archaeon]|nr:hypothetical protein [Candidatus Pacearchaeota archaeon]|tara:strand:- start:294 stop:509 length:216 start_codon:yes stop_codon:yes gene_type:complete